MGLVEVKAGDEKLGARRLQIMGPPASFKTTVAVGFDKPLVLVGLPGEKHTDIITPSEGVRVLVFPPPDYSDPKFDWKNLWLEIRTETHKLVTKGYGEFTTLILDGAHKAFYVCYMAAKQKFATDKGEREWDGRRGWTWVSDEFLAWFSQAFYSQVPWVVWIVWSAREVDDQDLANKVADRKKQIWADYMGKFQQTCMGETNIIYQYVEGGKPYWQIRQDERVKGVGLRVAPERAAQLPIRIEANWPKLKEILQPTVGAK